MVHIIFSSIDVCDIFLLLIKINQFISWTGTDINLMETVEKPTMKLDLQPIGGYSNSELRFVGMERGRNNLENRVSGIRGSISNFSSQNCRQFCVYSLINVVFASQLWGKQKSSHWYHFLLSVYCLASAPQKWPSLSHILWVPLFQLCPLQVLHEIKNNKEKCKLNCALLYYNSMSCSNKNPLLW